MASLLSDNSPIDAEALALIEADADKELGQFVTEWYSELKAKRAIWDRLWQEVRELVRPNAEDFTKKMPAALSRKQRIYDDHPTQCLQNLASGLQSNLTNAATRWFAYTTGDYYLDRRPEVAAWLEKESNGTFDDIYSDSAGFNYSSHELYLDWGGFGTAILNFLEDDKRVHFRTIPLAECYISENDYGIVDVLFRKFDLSKRAARMKFGKLPATVEKGENKEDPITFIHGVYPVESTGKWKSVYVHEASGEVVGKGIFWEFPYCVLRWTKMAGDVYGRSPGTDCLQNVRVLNEKVRVGLQGDQIRSAPPVVSEDDGVLSTIVLQPWGNIRIRPGSQFPKTLDIAGASNAGIESIEAVQDQISKAFYNDAFESTDYGNRERVTGQEVTTDQSSKLRKMSGVTGRAEIEFLGPLVRRVAKFRARTGKMTPPPMALHGKKIKLHYLSPASQAMRGIKAQNTVKFLQTVLPFMQYDQSILDPIDMDRVISETGFAMDISRDCVRGDAAVAAMRKQRSDQQQQQAQSEQALNATEAIKNVGQARQADPTMGGLVQQ